MPDVSTILTLAVVAFSMALFVTGKLPVKVIALCVPVVLTVLGLINPNQDSMGS